MINKREIICILAIFQIILLINAIIAQPYLINQVENSSVNDSIINTTKNLTKKAIVLLGGIFSIKQIGIVSALVLEGCCQELKSGAICEDIPITDTSSCKTSISQTKCSQLDSCRLGCCIDPDTGTCAHKSSKGKCESSGGEWYPQEDCQIIECKKGCCILGQDTQFINEKNCEKLSTLYGFEKNFKDLETETECISLAATQALGACTYEGGGCSFKTQRECLKNSGKFYKDYLCSNPTLETSCERQTSIGCIEGKDEIYWFDSCGNRENIYSSDKDASWNNGKVLSKEQSCNPSSSNINSEDCGNCNRVLSSVCATSSDKKVADGNFTCKGLECKDEKGKTRQNGESWCIYDSYVGDGKDTVGSEHWRAYCNNGIVEIDRCGDYRGKICVQKNIVSGNKEMAISECVENPASQCISYNSDPTNMAKKCMENDYCILKTISVASGFNFNFCTPEYPRGFNKNDYELNRNICSLATKTCNQLWVKDFSWPKHGFHWVCASNCECESKTFTDGMNDLCISLGDCGSYINYLGKGTNNALVYRAPPTNWMEYLNYKNVVYGQYAIPSDDPEEDVLTYGKKWSWKNFVATFRISLENWLWSGGFGVVLVFINFFGYGDTEIRTVSFTCLPWEAPLGGDDCEKCQENENKTCTEYRCSSLGQACVLLNPENEKPTCNALTKENTVPIISFNEIEKEYKFENITKEGLRIIGENKECIQEFTPVNFSLKTDEFAQCIYSFTFPLSSEFENMSSFNYPLEGNEFSINHTFGIFIPSLGSLSVYDVTGDLKEKFGKMSMYIRCRDYWGNYNPEGYTVNFCIHSGPDKIPVNHFYTKLIPPSSSILKYNQSEINISMYINEPAECKYSTSPEKTYDEMENIMTCETEVMNFTNLGWECNTTMSMSNNISHLENKFYIKCKDQPWFKGTINETDRNINQEDYEYTLYVSKTPLSIMSISPTGKVINGVEPFSVNLKVETAGGAKDGVSNCYFGEGLNTLFWETDSKIHTQTLNSMMSGNYSIPILCKDSSNNTAEAQINFTIELDTTPPMAIRTYREGGSLVVLTDEKAECYYTFNTCDFDIANAIPMTTALSTSHKTSWETGKTYYIKCRDVWKNTNPWCAIRVQVV